jgi:RNA polymerase sigma factor for flagellar operon FliA
MNRAATKAYQDASTQNERQALVVNNLPFVRHILGKLVGRLPSNIDADNLESAGVLGLVEASHQFEPHRGVAFRTFAYPRVWGAIIDELRRNSPLTQKLMNQISLVNKTLETLGPPATTERIAEASGLTTDEVETCLISMRLSSPSPLDQTSLNVVRDKRTESADARMETEELKLQLAAGIEALPEQQRLVVTLYYLEDMRLKEIGKVLNLSESRISRILSKAELRLRDMLSVRE